MRFLITGGTGFIGTALTKRWLGEGHQVTILTRNRLRAQSHFQGEVTAIEDLNELASESTPDVIVNLAGKNLGSGRWNEELKREFVTSRVETTERVVDYIGKAPTKPRVLISGSAVGYYGARGDKELDESASPGNEFQSELCQAWENKAREAETHGIRVCLSRTGVVLGAGGGALSGLLPMFRWGLGGSVGSGNQWMSWVHMEDVIGVFEHLIVTDSVSGSFNVTAPQPVTNRQFAHTLGAVLKRPTLMRVPDWVLRFMVGEMSHLYLTGQRVVPHRLLESGYRFRFPKLKPALEDIIH